MKTKGLFAVAACCLGLICGPGLSTAEETPDDLFTLGEIVVVGKSGVQNIAINNTVTAEDIQEIGAVNAAEALQHVPGVNVVRTSKGEMNINIHGFQQKDILVLIDGVPYYETKNGPLDLQQIPAGIIGRIEVTKGASSVLYGPNALGGVVNIVTKKGVKGTSGVVSVEGGRGGYGRGTATLNYGAENGFSVLGSIDYRTRDDLYFSDDHDPREASIRFRGPSDGRPNPRVIDAGDKKDNSDLESLNLWTRMGYEPSENLELYTSLYYFEMERGRPFSDVHNRVFNFPGGFSTFGRFDEYKDTGIDFGGRYSINKQWNLRAMAFYHSHVDDYTSYVSEDLETKIATSTWDDDAWGVSLFSDTDLGKYGLLSFSVQYRDDRHQDRDDVDLDWEYSESSTLTFAVEETLQIGQFTGILGLAYHDFEVDRIANLDGYSKRSFDPMAGLTWTGQSGLEIFGSVAKKTRFPTFADMEDNNQLYRLDPEENINYSLGVKHRIANRVNVALSGFFNDIDNRIGEINDEPANIDEAEIYGLELETRTKVTDRLSFGFDSVFIRARNKSEDRTSKYLEDVPEYTIGASINYMIPVIETRFVLKGTYKDSVIFSTDTEEKEYSTVVDLSLIKDWPNGFSLGGYINNLFDADYYEGKGMASNGFDFKMVARYEF